MTSKEMKRHLLAFSKTLDDKDKDEFYGTERNIWECIWPKFLGWYNSHHNMVRAKQQKQKEKYQRTKDKSMEVISCVQFTEEDIDKDTRFEGKLVKYFLVPVTRKKMFWDSNLWDDIQKLQGEVFFY